MDAFLEFVLFIMAAVGLSHVIADGSIFASLKVWLHGTGWFGQKLVEMANCYQCNSWWSGLLLSSCIWSLGHMPAWHIPLWAFAISLISPLVGYYKLYLALLTTMEEEQEDE